MTASEPPGFPTTNHEPLTAAIFDVDGVLLASPHEQAWREALLSGFAKPDLFITAMDQTHVVGKPRLCGARAALEVLGVPDANQQSVHYALAQQLGAQVEVMSGAIETSVSVAHSKSNIPARASKEAAPGDPRRV